MAKDVLTQLNLKAPLQLNGSAGTSGQVLTSAGTGGPPTWGSSGSFTGGTLTSDLILAAGSGTVEPLRFQANSATPVVTAGAWDYDGDKFYAVTSGTATGRLMVPAMAVAYSTANSSNATGTTPVSIFQAGARALTLEAAKTYYFCLNLGLNYSHAGTSTSVQFVPTFSQTPVAINYNSVFISATSGGVVGFRHTTAAASFITPGFGASVTGATVLIEGFFRSNATTGGTIEFKFQLSASNGATATMTTGSLQQVMKIGTGTPGVISGAWA
jgi:hypothetical protein